MHKSNAQQRDIFNSIFEIAQKRKEIFVNYFSLYFPKYILSAFGSNQLEKINIEFLQDFLHYTYEHSSEEYLKAIIPIMREIGSKEIKQDATLYPIISCFIEVGMLPMHVECFTNKMQALVNRFLFEQKVKPLNDLRKLLAVSQCQIRVLVEDIKK
ncbi:MAG: hypothetical protein HAW62_06545 [Endozoicomonadaceae bacterium]|nr:hypothetical protein [Endozoicomonadaceae bacterium]